MKKIKNILILTAIIAVVAGFSSCKKEMNEYQVACHRVGDTTFVSDNFWLTIAPGEEFEDIQTRIFPAYLQYLEGRYNGGEKNYNPGGGQSDKGYLVGKYVSIELYDYRIVHSNPDCPRPIHACFCSMKLGLKKLYSAVTSHPEARSEKEAMDLVIHDPYNPNGPAVDSVWIIRSGDHTNDYRN